MSSTKLTTSGRSLHQAIRTSRDTADNMLLLPTSLSLYVLTALNALSQPVTAQAFNPASLVGTWTSKSAKVLTGPVCIPTSHFSHNHILTLSSSPGLLRSRQRSHVRAKSDRHILLLHRRRLLRRSVIPRHFQPCVSTLYSHAPSSPRSNQH